jgi:hypothetical protein
MTTAPKQGFIEKLNGPWHERALWVYLAIVIIHWVEHLFQAARGLTSGCPARGSGCRVRVSWLSSPR